MLAGICRVPEQCPADIAQLVRDCMNFEPSQRPTAQEIIDRLQRPAKASMGLNKSYQADEHEPHRPGWG